MLNDIDLARIKEEAETAFKNGENTQPLFTAEVVLSLIKALENINFNIDPNTPKDFINPNWNNMGRVHEWKNHISEELQVIWHTFTIYQKSVIALQAEQQASAEDWE